MTSASEGRRQPLLLCDAIPFGYGPVSKLIAIIDRLRGQNIRVVALAAGTSRELLDKFGVETVVVDVEDERALDEHHALFEQAQLFLNVMNPISLRYAQSVGCTTASVDSLFWMWDEVDEGSRRSDIYFVQNFPGVPERLQELEAEIENAVLTGPIIEKAARSGEPTPAPRQIIVHLGGLESSQVRWDRNLRYPFLVARALERALANHPYEHVLLAGHSGLRDALAGVKIPRFSIVNLAHSEFIRELARSEIVITSPGLTTTYECFSHGVPVFFLPPQNFSQFHILSTLRSLRLAPLSISWSDFNLGVDIPARIEESEGVRRVLSCIERAHQDRHVADLIGNGIATALQISTRDVTRRQSAFVREMGGDGAATVATRLLELL